MSKLGHIVELINRHFLGKVLHTGNDTITLSYARGVEDFIVMYCTSNYTVTRPRVHLQCCQKMWNYFGSSFLIIVLFKTEGLTYSWDSLMKGINPIIHIEESIKVYNENNVPERHRYDGDWICKKIIASRVFLG